MTVVSPTLRKGSFIEDQEASLRNRVSLKMKEFWGWMGETGAREKDGGVTVFTHEDPRKQRVTPLKKF